MSKKDKKKETPAPKKKTAKRQVLKDEQMEDAKGGLSFGVTSIISPNLSTVLIKPNLVVPKISHW